MVSVNKRNGLFGRVWADDDFPPAEDQPADFSGGLTSLGFIRGAIKRGVWLWGGLALTGLLLGAGLYMKTPPVSQASTTLFLKVGPESGPGTAIANEQVVAQSRPVAALALKDLHLQEDVDSFIQSYSVTVITDQVLRITADAPSSSEAVRRASALAQAFLQFRAGQLKAQQTRYFSALDQALAEQKQLITTLNRDITEALAEPGQQDKVKSLRTQRSNATGTLATLVQQFNSEKAATAETTAQQLNESRVVDPAAAVTQARHARLKHLITYAVLGLIGGLTIGLGIVIIRGLVSDRLRRRDDVAYALSAPVKLSVGRVGSRRRSGGGLAAAQDRDIQRIAAYLRRAAPQSTRGAATLAVVPVDSTQVAALSVVSLALSCAEHGQRVVLADLAPGRPAASLIDTAEPGVRIVDVEGRKLVLAVPDPDEEAPPGPLGAGSRETPPTLVKAVSAAGLLLTLVTLDPSTGGDHLATWATEAVVVVTAGRSSWTKIHAAGEMIRLAGTRLLSAVLVGADKSDESLGVTNAPGPGRDAEAADSALRADADGPVAAVDNDRSFVSVDNAERERSRTRGDQHVAARHAVSPPPTAPR